MYRLALIKFHKRADEAIMMGDQMMTDILGANRAGIEAMWVRQTGHHEFIGTRFNRFIEHFLKGAIYSALITPIDERPQSAEIEASKPVQHRTIVHQIIRFVMVGGVAFIIDFAIRGLLLHVLSFDGELASHTLGHTLRANYPGLFAYAQSDEKAAAPLAFGVASLAAMTASFVMNRTWTFEVRGREERMKQARRFYAVCIGGYFINLGISNFIFNSVPATFRWGLLLASMCGAGVGAVWNFVGSRYYAFRS
jgi:putative flippase GtrA